MYFLEPIFKKDFGPNLDLTLLDFNSDLIFVLWFGSTDKIFHNHFDFRYFVRNISRVKEGNETLDAQINDKRFKKVYRLNNL